MSLHPVSCVIYVPHHTPVRKKKKSKCLPCSQRKINYPPSKMKSYVLIWWEVFKEIKSIPLKYSGHLYNPPRVWLNVLLTKSLLATY